MGRLESPVVRLIPAWAGKTQWPLTKSFKVSAHPRVGGENAITRLEEACHHGSSPRGRGKRVVTRMRRRWGAHPRVGGENRVC